jgi:hypothetical protein
MMSLRWRGVACLALDVAAAKAINGAIHVHSMGSVRPYGRWLLGEDPLKKTDGPRDS